MAKENRLQFSKDWIKKISNLAGSSLEPASPIVRDAVYLRQRVLASGAVHPPLY